jgi:hypothetical protein
MKCTDCDEEAVSFYTIGYCKKHSPNPKIKKDKIKKNRFDGKV